jgi:sugar phosphate isomerase/epimerase
LIKLGSLAYMFEKDHPERQVDVETFIRFAYELRLDVVDFKLGVGFESNEPDYLRRIKMACLKYGLPIGYLGVPGDYTGPPEKVRERVDYAKIAVDVASFIGAPMVRLFAGHLPKGVDDREPLFPAMVRAHQEIADYALDKGIIVGLQNHDNRNLAATDEHVLRILRETDRENYTFIMDTGQWVGSIGATPVGEFDPDVDIYSYMEKTVAYASAVRAKIFKIDSGKEEFIDYERVLKILKAVDFNGNISIVYEGQGISKCDDATAIRLAVDHLRGLLAAY